MRQRLVFHVLSFLTDCLALLSVVLLLYGLAWNYAVAEYSAGFADSRVAAIDSDQEKYQTLLKWVANTPPALRTCLYPAYRSPLGILSARQEPPTDCGSYANAFLRLSAASGVRARRLLLLDAANQTKHVVAEVWLDHRWVAVDPTRGAFFTDNQGRFLTKQDLHDPATFREAIARIPGYPSEYDFANVVHVRLEFLPFVGHGLRRALDDLFPSWDDAADWGYFPDHQSLWPILWGVILLPFGGCGTSCSRQLRAEKIAIRSNPSTPAPP